MRQHGRLWRKGSVTHAGDRTGAVHTPASS
jgi:hypothetical protein